MKSFFEKAKKILSYSIGSITLVSLVAAFFSLIKGIDLLKTVLNSNYVVGAIIIAVGILGFIVPFNLKKSNRLVDHSNIVDVLREEKDIKMGEAIINILWGISNIILVGLIEIILYNFFT